MPSSVVTESVLTASGLLASMPGMVARSNTISAFDGTSTLVTLYCTGGTRAANSPVAGSVVMVIVFTASSSPPPTWAVLFTWLLAAS